MEVDLTVDRKNIEMNDFVQKILGTTFSASAENLQGVEENWTKMEISIKRCF